MTAPTSLRVRAGTELPDLRQGPAEGELHPVDLASLVSGPEHAAVVAFLGLWHRGAIRPRSGSLPALPFDRPVTRGELAALAVAWDVVDGASASEHPVHLAGALLNPETFRDAMLRAPVAGGGPTVPRVSRGQDGIWDDSGSEPDDRGGTDDVALIWWDPNATGRDEDGRHGQGMYRYANRGRRYAAMYLPRSLEEARLFDERASVTVFDEIPEEDRTPDYPPPDL